ncbi:MAG: AMP-forming long-chain acyl-CoA synthetase [Candidatus Woesebacteria bacterium GW2011_GWD1_31_12]|nr:MAG: AMP-forming long-chain acyl-CoA synthetase [Candidatus Woesebacteria bacterium GW2011_GWD1_31_12]
MSNQESLFDLWENSRASYADLPFLGFIGEPALDYKSVHLSIQAFQKWFFSLGLVPGDKVAIFSANQPSWGVAYLAVVTCGMVAVPILADFHPREVQNIIEAGQVKLTLVGKSLESALKDWYESHPNTTNHHFYQLEATTLMLKGQEDTENSEIFPSPKSEDLAALIYTSGTTGTSKGVMLSHGNLVSNVISSGKIPPIHSGDEFLSVLPLAHTYECTLGLLLPMYAGCRVHYLNKPASPSVLLAALEEVRPQLMLTVPLLIEKVYKSKIKPQLTKGILGFLSKIPILSTVIYKAAGKKLYASFGGRLQFFGIGGAPLDPEVEKFLYKGRFPYSIGYGLTETAPLLCGAPPLKAPLGSTGPAIDGVRLRLADIDSNTGVGEIQVKGPNVMKGYFNNPEATAECFTPDGWFKTGDLGVVDSKGMVTIRGRLKSVILSSSGENIYPEAIEALINQTQFVTESLVVSRGKDLVAKVVINYEAFKESMHSWGAKAQDLQSEVTKYLKYLQEEVNKHLNKFSKISNVEEHGDPFEKTPTLKIKRYLYRDDQKKTK